MHDCNDKVAYRHPKVMLDMLIRKCNSEEHVYFEIC